MKEECYSIYHLSQIIMWIGGYDDWTPAEQREWDRDQEEMQEECEAKNEDKLYSMKLALDYPKFQATYTKIGDRFVCG